MRVDVCAICRGPWPCPEHFKFLGPLVCDFCSLPEPQHTFEVTAPDVSMGALVSERSVEEFNSVGVWMACDECARLVRSNARQALEDRAAAAVADLGVKDARAMIRAAHDAFFSVRKRDD